MTENAQRKKCPNTEFFSGPHIFAFGLNTETYGECGNAGKYGPEKTPYLDSFHAVMDSITIDFLRLFQK